MVNRPAIQLAASSCALLGAQAQWTNQYTMVADCLHCFADHHDGSVNEYHKALGPNQNVLCHAPMASYSILIAKSWVATQWA